MARPAIQLTTDARVQLRLERIRRAADKAQAGYLRSVGYLVSLLAKKRIVRSSVKAPPGQPPTTRRGLLRRAIRYAVAPDRQSVVIGPTHVLVGTAGQPHEHGGWYKGERYPPRPFMGPALEEASPLIGPLYKLN
jgi:hypothetical protein